jgi:hypothetical protein
MFNASPCFARSHRLHCSEEWPSKPGLAMDNARNGPWFQAHTGGGLRKRPVASAASLGQPACYAVRRAVRLRLLDTVHVDLRALYSSPELATGLSPAC